MQHQYRIVSMPVTTAASRRRIGQRGTDQDVCLDIVDCLLRFRGSLSRAGVDELSLRLTVGRSVWDTAPDGDSLVRRTDPTATDRLRATTAPNDMASVELAHAWEKIYGRQRDASDSWDHAIKAAETALIPLVCPKKDKANLGSVAGQLKSTPNAWNLTFDNAAGIGGIATLEAMLRLMWPNPDRHQDELRRSRSRLPGRPDRLPGWPVSRS